MHRPRRRSRRHAILALALAVWLAPGLAGAEEEDAEATLVRRSTGQRIADSTFDVLFLRTSGLVVAGVGAALFVPAAIVTSPGGKRPLGDALERFVLVPGNYLVTRPLGEF